MMFLLLWLGTLTADAKDFKLFYSKIESLSKEARILKSLEFFRGTPSGLDPLGEGQGLDPDVTYSLKKFDCTTYVETLLAIAFSESEADIPNQLTQIRYQNGRTNFFERNHFMVTDWIPANTQKKIVKEITVEIAQDPKAYATDKRNLNKTFWFYHRVIDLMDRQKKPASEVLAKLKQVPIVPKQEDKATYLRAKYFRENVAQLKDKLPAVSIFMFIRYMPNVPTLISHMGFVFQRNGKLYLSHAPQAKPWKIQEELLEDYFINMDAHRAPVEGLLVLKLADQ